MGARRRAAEGRLKRFLVLAGQLALTALVTWFIADRVGLSFDQLRGVDWKPDLAMLTASCLLLLLGYFVSAALWGRIVVDLGGPTLPVLDSIRMFMVANLGRYVPGKVWQIAGLAVMARNRGVPAGTATAAAVLGQGIALVAATLVGLGALVGGPPEIRRWGLPGAAVVVVVTAVGLMPAVFGRASRLWFRLARQDAPPALGSVHALRWLGLYVANWALYAFSFWLLAASFGYRGEVVPVGSAFAAAYVLGYIVIFAPAGVGVREGFLVAFLTPFFGAGPSAALALVARVWTTLVELFPAAAFWLWQLARGREPVNGGGGAGE
ncbi:MAG: lysylphosphatidylglycerol synthase domain-containing protein [Longimicrobiales bacterium]